ncbi:adenosylmethionine--8-amino-7-oxononanoate transaminase [Blastopirellula sp. J2-11]|uniref:adenosylmethionine--8-amino-7-oxononanoate transaminase n=1 Tax=Blastopirellula sp. J2-11 TaxID=2943192 RepID=UPI0021C99871|nr:adenosylmethionine--8-amino-7-oxononanoate transaminase [Blastopirellula sp. J2-11]UUO08553.1 adenosylmethionine--8-amino-7-oxononanoate transaminase [Blastopirellula sp. J2-11]
MNLTHQQLRDWDRSAHWHSFTQMAEYEPLIIERGEGCMLYDIDGNAYLDGVSSLWCNTFGHRHPKIDQAIRDQLDKVAHVTNLGCSSVPAIELTKRIVDLAPGELNHVFYACDGSSAVEVALKMAFQYWRQRDDPRPNKTGYIAFHEAYHGDTLGAVSVGGVEMFHDMFRPLLFSVHRLPSPDRDHLPDGVTSDTACRYYLDQLEAVLKEHHETIAALVIEPLVQGAAGMLMQPAGYLRGLRELTTKYDVLLIFDEIAVGMGRTGTMFACQQEEVTPDFLCLGKGLTSGYLPLSVTVATTEVWNAFLGTYAERKTFFHGHTFSGNPLLCAAALATLDIFEKEKILDQLPAKIAHLEMRLAELIDHPHVASVRQCGLIAGVELVADKETGESYPWTERRGWQACRHATQNGVWLRPLGNVIVIMPPLSITLDEIDRICDAAKAGIDHAVAPCGE